MQTTVKDSTPLPFWDVQGLYRALPLAQHTFSAATRSSPVCNLSVGVGTVFHDGFIYVVFEISRSVQPGGYWIMIQKIWLMERHRGKRMAWTSISDLELNGLEKLLLCPCGKSATFSLFICPFPSLLASGSLFTAGLISSIRDTLCLECFHFAWCIFLQFS